MAKASLHFQASKGWINDPNGLCFYNGKYHLFFQHNPFSTKWSRMHWGHAVSSDLLHWEELPIAMYPDEPYESTGGCFSGSAVVQDGIMYVFYTSVGENLASSQCMAVCRDGKTLEKYEKNPIISLPPADTDPRNFRDPKVGRFKDTWYMVLGGGKDGMGRILLYTSKDLYQWDYRGVLYESSSYPPCIECPDLFPLDGKYVLSFSVMTDSECGTRMVTGDFDGLHFIPETEYRIEQSRHFYAPQSFEHEGRRLMLGWLRDFPEEDGLRCGAISAPRELHIENGRLVSRPAAELAPYLNDTDPNVEVRENGVFYKGQRLCNEQISAYCILHDGPVTEIFADDGGKNLVIYDPACTQHDHL